TPPVLVGNDQAVAATLATKFPNASRVIAYTIIELAAVMFCAGTTIPLPSAAVSTRTTLAAPAITVKVPESVVDNAPEVARTVAVPTKWPVKVALLLSAAATRSPLTTPPVLVGNVQALPARRASDLPCLSRVIA